MMDMISVIRQMMADEKFVEAQIESEKLLLLKDESLRKSVLPLFLASLISQNKQLPASMVLDVAESFIDSDINLCLYWFSQFPEKEKSKFFLRYLRVQIHLAESRGLSGDLYELISLYQITLFTSRVPVVPEQIRILIQKYFPHDFNLSLQRLSLEIMIGDYQSAIASVRQLILNCFEQSSPRSTLIKLGQIVDIIETSKISSHLDVYKNLCHLYVNGIKNKLDYKKLAEAVIYFDDFKFQTLVMELLRRLNINELESDYAASVRENKDYDFVYFDKYFPELKGCFVTIEEKTKPKELASLLTTDDLRLKGKAPKQSIESFTPLEDIDEEMHFIHMLSFQEFSQKDLLDVATSFLQSRMFKVSLKASDLALKASKDTESYLKSAYLKIISLLQLQDYRAALDLSIQATGKAINPEDVLSFLYVQAELLIKLGQNKSAKNILEQIQSIDSDYRLTKERLIKLDEI